MTAQLKNSELPCFCGNCGIYNLCFEKNTDDIKYYLDYFDSNKQNMKEYDYMVRMEVLGRSYKRATQVLDLDYLSEDTDEDEVTEVEQIMVTRNNTIDLVGLPGEFINKFMNHFMLVDCEISATDGKRLVFPSISAVAPSPSPMRHIYYDNGDNKFKEERNWADIILDWN